VDKSGEGKWFSGGNFQFEFLELEVAFKGCCCRFGLLILAHDSERVFGYSVVAEVVEVGFLFFSFLLFEALLFLVKLILLPLVFYLVDLYLC